MRKTWIILRSEFVRRITSKWFIATTLLAPVLMLAVIFVPVLITHLSSESDQRTVVVLDETGVLLPRLQEEESSYFSFVEGDRAPAVLRQAVRDSEYDGLLHLREGVRRGENPPTYYSTEGGGFTFRARIDELVGRVVEEQRLEDIQASPDVVEVVRARTSVSIVTLTDEGQEADGTPVLSIVGYVMGFFIWFAVIIYGSLVMTSVMEEKASRVMEVVVSSVRPFQLLLGKVIGVGLAGLLQMTVWGILILGLAAFGGTILASFMDPASLDLGTDASSEAVLNAAGIVIPSIPLSLVVWFVLFFIGGYLLYASLYAAIGASVEEYQDAQTMSVPITFVLLVPMILIGMIIENPNSAASVVLTMVPFFSPVLMIVREAVADVSFWQVALSFVLLVGAFLGSIWVSSRIYRVGILMYGKKPSVRELLRWLRQA